MGTKSTYKCNKCNYSVETSAGFDYGFLAAVDTYICKSCNSVVDVAVGIYGKKYTRAKTRFLKIDNELKLDFYQCPVCNSDSHLIKWNIIKRPCPKCDGKMEIDMDGMMVLWD